MAEGGDWDIPGGGGYDDRDDNTDEHAPLFPDVDRDDGWTEGRRPSSHRSSRRHQYETGRGTSSGFDNPSFEVEEGVKLDESIFEFADERQNEAKRKIQEKYPDWDPTKSRFVATIIDNKVNVSLIEGKKFSTKKYVLFNKDGTLRKGLSQKIVEDLGRTTFEIVDWRDSRIDELWEENEKLRESVEKTEKKLGRYDQKKEKIKELEAKSVENEETINSLKEDLKQLENQRGEDLRRTKEDYEARVEKLKKDNEEMEKLKKDNDERSRKKSEKYEKEMNEKNGKISDLQKRLDLSKREKDQLIAVEKEDHNRLKKEKDEALKRAKEDYEEKLKESEQMIVANEREKMEKLKEDNDKRKRETNDKYEKETNEKISDLKRRLDLSEKERKDLIAAAKEDLKRLENQKDEALKRAEKDYKAKVEELREDNIALGEDREKFYDDKISNLKSNYDEHVREITNGYEERIKEKKRTDIQSYERTKKHKENDGKFEGRNS